jgi:hypothetical protein
MASRNFVKGNRKRMTLSLVLAFVSLVLWIILGFVTPVAAGWVHLFYAAAVMLIARRILVGAPKFLS